MLYLFEISKKWAFQICMGGGGGGVGIHIFSEIRAEVGSLPGSGLSVPNTQVAKQGCVVFRALLGHIVELRGNTYIFEIGTLGRINLPPGIFSQGNDMFEKLRAQGKYTTNQQAAGQPDLQISGRSVQLSQAVQPRHRFNKQRDLFFWIPHVQNKGVMCTTQNGTAHGASEPDF